MIGDMLVVGIKSSERRSSTAIEVGMTGATAVVVSSWGDRNLLITVDCFALGWVLFSRGYGNEWQTVEGWYGSEDLNS